MEMNLDVHVPDYRLESDSYCDTETLRSGSRCVPSIGDAESTTTSSSCTSCHLCGYESGRHSNLKRHMKTMHQAITSKEFQCCDINFQDKAEYRDHCRQIHQDGHTCPTCQRRFSRRALLHRHQSVHTGYKEFNCLICSYASSHKSNLERHLKTHSSLKTQEHQRKRKSRLPVHPQPDSTTPGTFTPTTTVKEFPILRTMLKTHSSSPPIYKTVKSKPKLSHSIDSILNRKDKPRKSSPFFVHAPPLLETEVSNQSELPSGIPEDGSEIMRDEFHSNLTLLSSPSPPSPAVQIHPIINYPLSSPFTLPSFSQELRNQQRALAFFPWRTPSCIYQDLRIFSSTNYTHPYLQEVSVSAWAGLSTSHIMTNYSYPRHGDNGNTLGNSSL